MAVILVDGTLALASLCCVSTGSALVFCPVAFVDHTSNSFETDNTMATSGDSETSTIDATFDAPAHKPKDGSHDHSQPHVAFSPSPDPAPHNGTPVHVPQSHDPARPDLSFPFQTTDTEQAGFTDEYRVTSKTGYISADLALRPVPSHLHKLPHVLADPEKALRLKEVRLVTWMENDPEDPRNWSAAYKWCEWSSSPLNCSRS